MKRRSSKRKSPKSEKTKPRSTRSTKSAIKPVTKQRPPAVVKQWPGEVVALRQAASSLISPSSVIIPTDDFYLFIRQHLPSFVPDLLLEHCARYLKALFVSPKDHTLTMSLFALHQDQHWHTHGPQPGEPGYRTELEISQETMVGNGGWCTEDLFAHQLYYHGYVQTALESLLRVKESMSMRMEHRLERERLPFFLKLCQDCRLVLLQVLYLANSPVMNQRSCPYRLPADVQSFLTADVDFVDYYKYFKPKSTDNGFIADCLKMYCGIQPKQSGALDLISLQL